MKTVLTTAVLFAGLLQTALAHCEIPCGIYDDPMRIDMIEEHCKTIEKSMDQIRSGANGDQNQLVRWISNKEKHADEIQHIVSQYFLTQRIKPDTDHYEQKLALLHQMLVAAMKCKQTTDAANVAKVRELSAAFAELYFGHAETEAHDAGDGHEH